MQSPPFDYVLIGPKNAGDIHLTLFVSLSFPDAKLKRLVLFCRYSLETFVALVILYQSRISRLSSSKVLFFVHKKLYEGDNRGVDEIGKKQRRSKNEKENRRRRCAFFLNECVHLFLEKCQVA